MGPFAAIRFLHRAWKARRRSERVEIGALCGLVKPGDLVVDIGAHKGSYLYWLRRSVGPTGLVLAFEPQPVLAAYLQEVVRTFRWSQVEVRPQGVSEQCGSLTLIIPDGPGIISPEASFERGSGRGGGREVQVEVTCLDREFAVGSRAPTFIKCDVEGHELAVFRGGRALLEREGPVLLFECEQRHLGERSVHEVFAELASLGYTGQFFGPDGLRPVSEFRAEVHQPRIGGRFWDRPGYCNNFLFVRPSRTR